jgi:hypothetical protein
MIAPRPGSAAVLRGIAVRIAIFGSWLWLGHTTLPECANGLSECKLILAWGFACFGLPGYPAFYFGAHLGVVRASLLDTSCSTDQGIPLGLWFGGLSGVYMTMVLVVPCIMALFKRERPRWSAAWAAADIGAIMISWYVGGWLC